MLRGGRTSRTNTLKPGETACYRVGAVIPRDTPAGTYCLGIIVDSFNKVRESNEENNSKCARIRIHFSHYSSAIYCPNTRRGRIA